MCLTPSDMSHQLGGVQGSGCRLRANCTCAPLAENVAWGGRGPKGGNTLGESLLAGLISNTVQYRTELILPAGPACHDQLLTLPSQALCSCQGTNLLKENMQGELWIRV